MGYGFVFTCHKCKEKNWIKTGVGMGYPNLFRRTVQNVKDGYYGNRMKRIAKSIRYAAVDAEKKFYYCRCEYWKTELDMSIYEPINVEDLLNKQFGIKTVHEWGYVPYVTRCDFEKDYNQVWKYKHYCPRCHREMAEIERFCELPLRCVKCGERLRNDGEFDWD